MNLPKDNNDFALVPRPSSAVEKVEPGTKRVLSGMVADTLALVKRQKLPRIVVVDDEKMLLDLYEMFIREIFKDVTVLTVIEGEEAWHDILRITPDVLITDMNRPGLNGWKMLPLLASRKVKFPILVTSGTADEHEVRQCAGSELAVSFLAKPCNMRLLAKYLRSALKIPYDAAKLNELTLKTRLLRVVVVDDADASREILKMLIKDWFKDVTLLLFSNTSEAWQELLQRDPDLLIFRTPSYKPELLPLLAERKVKYPILVTSGFFDEKEIRESADPYLDVSFLPLPFSMQEFHRQLHFHLGPSDNPKFAESKL